MKALIASLILALSLSSCSIVSVTHLRGRTTKVCTKADFAKYEETVKYLQVDDRGLNHALAVLSEEIGIACLVVPASADTTNESNFLHYYDGSLRLLNCQAEKWQLLAEIDTWGGRTEIKQFELVSWESFAVPRD